MKKVGKWKEYEIVVGFSQALHDLVQNHLPNE